MKIEFTKSNTDLTVSLDGRLDTVTAPELESFLAENYDGKGALTLDLAKLSYISSAGLRVLLGAQKKAKDAQRSKNATTSQALISSKFAACSGRKAEKNRKIYNGMLKTYLYQFMGPKPPKKPFVKKEEA